MIKTDATKHFMDEILGHDKIEERVVITTINGDTFLGLITLVGQDFIKLESSVDDAVDIVIPINKITSIILGETDFGGEEPDV